MLTGWAETKNFETNLLIHKAKQLDENKLMPEFLRLYCLTTRQRAPVFEEQIVNEAQPSWLSLLENDVTSGSSVTRHVEKGSRVKSRVQLLSI